MRAKLPLSGHPAICYNLDPYLGEYVSNSSTPTQSVDNDSSELPCSFSGEPAIRDKNSGKSMVPLPEELWVDGGMQPKRSLQGLSYVPLAWAASRYRSTYQLTIYHVPNTWKASDFQIMGGFVSVVGNFGVCGPFVLGYLRFWVRAARTHLTRVKGAHNKVP